MMAVKATFDSSVMGIKNNNSILRKYVKLTTGSLSSLYYRFEIQLLALQVRSLNVQDGN